MSYTTKTLYLLYERQGSTLVVPKTPTSSFSL
jgi:hypothetical protein